MADESRAMSRPCCFCVPLEKCTESSYRHAGIFKICHQNRILVVAKCTYSTLDAAAGPLTTTR